MKKKFSVADECRKLSKKPTKKSKQRIKEILGEEVGGQRPGTWPQISMAMGVHPKQVNHANARLKATGTTAYHLPDGRLVLPDAGQRKKVIKMQPHRVDLESFS